MSIQQLNHDFAIPGQLEFIKAEGGFPFIKIHNASATALISVYGGQVLSFKPHDQAHDLLYLSPKSIYAEGKAIRGGIPVCWPWFGPDPKGLNRPNHGFVRNNYWLVTRTEALSAAETKITLVFKESSKKERTWQKPFRLQLEITIGTGLSLRLCTENTGENAFSITQAFHTYFRVGHINAVQIQGLEGCEYFDKLDQGAQKIQQDVVTIGEEVDRIYTDVQKQLLLLDAAYKRRIQITSCSTKTAVVWNPWVKTTRKMPDLANNAYKEFICVEAGNIALDLVQIQPGSSASLSANFFVLPD